MDSNDFQDMITNFDAWPLYIVKVGSVVRAIGMLHARDLLLALPRTELAFRIEEEGTEFYFHDWNVWLRNLDMNKVSAFEVLYADQVLFCDVWFEKMEMIARGLLNKDLAKNIWTPITGLDFAKDPFMPEDPFITQLATVRTVELLENRKFVRSSATDYIKARYLEICATENPVTQYVKRLFDESHLPPQIDEGIIATLDDAGVRARLRLS